MKGRISFLQFFVLSDNIDTVLGLRLAGLDGEVVHTELELKDYLKDLLRNEKIGIVLLSSNLVRFCKDYIFNIKLNVKRPLIVEIPDRYNFSNSNMKTFESMADYVHRATGMSIDL